MILEKIKESIQSCHLNFLFGSGISRPFLIALTNIEELLSELEENFDIPDKNYELIKFSIYKKYFEGVIQKFLEEKIEEDTQFIKVLEDYKSLLSNLYEMVLNRDSSLVNKQINLFTTNIDTFFDRACEEVGLNINDGFKGKTKPIFDLSNYLLSYYKTSLHYENTFEIPVFNLFKLHGSINWKLIEENIISIDIYNRAIRHVDTLLKEIHSSNFLKVSEDSTLETLNENAKAKLKNTKINSDKISSFSEAYEKLQIVNPTKEKFSQTILNVYYYEMLRMFANQLEKENTILFVMGFSFRDEHIREIILRAVNSNPTLMIYVFAYNEESKENMKELLGIENHRIRNNNIEILCYKDIISVNNDEEESEKVLDLEAICNHVFKQINIQVSTDSDLKS